MIGSYRHRLLPEYDNAHGSGTTPKEGHFGPDFWNSGPLRRKSEFRKIPNFRKIPKNPDFGAPPGGVPKKGKFREKNVPIGWTERRRPPSKILESQKANNVHKNPTPPPPRTKKALLRGGGPPPLPGPPLRAPPRGGPGGVVREGAKFVPGRIRRPADPEKQAPNLSLAD